MLYRLGRALQVIGMLILPIAMAGNLVPDQPLDSRGMLALAGIGVVVFLIGYGLQQMGKQQK
jgi:predicted acyltransferase